MKRNGLPLSWSTPTLVQVTDSTEATAIRRFWYPANVLIVETPSATGADKVLTSLRKDAARGRKRAEIEKRTIAKANIKRRQTAQDEYQRYRDIALKLYELKPTKRRASQEELAADVQAVLKRRGIKKSTKTIKRGLMPNK
jgi:hypothetical protein